MEHKGVYNKGHAGHPRNASSYRISLQKFKKWRWPATIAAVVFLIFGVAPVVGEEFQASLLTAELTEQLASAQPEDVKKSLLDVVYSISSDCRKYEMTGCESEGQYLANRLAVGEFDGNVDSAVAGVRDFEGKYSRQLAVAACKYELAPLFSSEKQNQLAVREFLDKYGDVLDSPVFAQYAAGMESSVSSLSAFVDYCYRQ